MSINERKKASDVFQETDYFIGEKTSFEKAFPLIDDIKVEIIEDGEGVSDWNKKRYYNKSNAGEYINCSNHLCYNGGFNLGEIIRYMEQENLIEHQTTKICQGYEGSPKGRKKYGDCCNMFDVKIKIKYKELKEE